MHETRNKNNLDFSELMT